MCRTFDWQAPETLLGQRASYPADIWSYGVILLEIISNVHQERGRYDVPQCVVLSPCHLATLLPLFAIVRIA